MKNHGVLSRRKDLCCQSKRVACAFVLCAISITAVVAQRSDDDQEIRLRSFAPGASGRINLVASADGGRVRLTALGLPAPQEVSVQARVFVIWAAAAERAAERVGLLETDARGNGGLEFPLSILPAAFDRFSVIVTAEPNADVNAPTGAPVLSTRAREVVRARGERPTNAAERRGTDGTANERRARRNARNARRGTTTSFYDEVNAAVDSGGGRTLELVGSEATPNASGTARVAAHNANAYARARFQRLALPIENASGARFFVLWAIASDGRIFYMGSLPNEYLNETEVYVRVNDTRADSFALAVTVEDVRPTIRPAGRRALSTREP